MIKHITLLFIFIWFSAFSSGIITGYVEPTADTTSMNAANISVTGYPDNATYTTGTAAFGAADNVTGKIYINYSLEYIPKVSGNLDTIEIYFASAPDKTLAEFSFALWNGRGSLSWAATRSYATSGYVARLYKSDDVKSQIGTGINPATYPSWQKFTCAWKKCDPYNGTYATTWPSATTPLITPGDTVSFTVKSASGTLSNFIYGIATAANCGTYSAPATTLETVIAGATWKQFANVNGAVDGVTKTAINYVAPMRLNITAHPLLVSIGDSGTCGSVNYWKDANWNFYTPLPTTSYLLATAKGWNHSNYAIPGTNLSTIDSTAAAVVAASKARIVLVHGGGIDTFFSSYSDVDTLKTRFNTLISTLRAAGVKTIILCDILGADNATGANISAAGYTTPNLQIRDTVNAWLGAQAAANQDIIYADTSTKALGGIGDNRTEGNVNSIFGHLNTWKIATTPAYGVATGDTIHPLPLGYTQMGTRITAAYNAKLLNLRGW